MFLSLKLYYIFILHQTTTSYMINYLCLGCIISSFYIKPQQISICCFGCCCCIISSFYIKPQPMMRANRYYRVVLYLHSTSNHNQKTGASAKIWLYYIFILHQTTTRSQVLIRYISCIISSFYIKPQRREDLYPKT